MKAKKYYTSCLDVNQTIQSLGARPLLDLIHEKFRGWTFNWDLAEWNFQDVLENIHMHGTSGFFSFWVAEDEKEPTKNILQVNCMYSCLKTVNIYTVLVRVRGGQVVWCRTCDREVVGSNPARGCCVPAPTQCAIPPGSVNEYQRKLGSKRAYHTMHWPRICGLAASAGVRPRAN